MMRTRTPVTASCPRCRSSNSVELADLLSQADLAIRCRHCQAEYPIRLRPGLPAARAVTVSDPTPPPLTALPRSADKAKAKDPASDRTADAPPPEGWLAGSLRRLRTVAGLIQLLTAKPHQGN